MIRKALIFALFALLPLPALAAATPDAGVRVVVPAHDIPRGETIRESDLTYATVPGNALMAGVVTKFDGGKGHGGAPRCCTPARLSDPTMCAGPSS